MKYIEVDIYMNQLVSFFEKNPNDLISLIGELQKDDFYKKVKETCIKNFKESGDVIPTQKQLIDIVVELVNKLMNLREFIESKNIPCKFNASDSTL